MTLLVAGMVAELRKKDFAAAINAAGYGLILVLFAWDCVSLVDHPEHLLPYLLDSGLPSFLIPLCVFLLYRREICLWCRAASRLLSTRRANDGV